LYVPAHFTATEQDVRSLLESVTAADLITGSPDGLTATFLPLLYEPSVGEHGALLGHVARNNAHWQLAGADSLVILRAADGYISPSWYAAKREHGRVVPTWNYLTVHVHGPLTVHDNVDWLRDVVTRLTDRHEAAFAQPWSVADAPATYIDGQLRAIVGVSVPITRIEAKAKLSQNRSGADQDGAVAGLSAGTSDEQALARLMSAHRTE
jgi:transcriptional regulator